MLYALALVLVLVIGVFGVMKPAFDSYDAASEKRMLLEEEKMGVQMQIMLIDSYRNGISQVNNRIEGYKRLLFPRLHPDATSVALTDIIVACGLNPHEMTVTYPTESGLKNFGSHPGSFSAAVPASTVLATFEGPISAFAAFIGELEKLDCVSIQKITQSTSPGGSGDRNLYTVMFEVFMPLYESADEPGLLRQY